jgi:predicted dehydrogenase
MRAVRAGVIGLGIGEQHAYGYSHAPGCRLVGLCDYSSQKLSQVSSHYQSVNSTTRWRELINDSGIDVVSIASCDDDHAEQTIAALKAGKSVFVEKPLCRSMEELVEIKKFLKADPTLHLASNLVLRAAAIYQWLRAAVRRGDFGEIYAIDGDYLYGRIHKITEGWRKDVNKYSVMQGGGVHLIDLMLWLTEQLPMNVYSGGNRICTRDSVFRENDFVASTFSFASGMVGRITANFGCVHRHQHVLRVFGTKATFILDDCGPRVHHSRDPEGKVEYLDQATLPSAKWDLIPPFVQEISSGNRREQTSQHEFDLMSVCLAADRSLVEKDIVEIAYL